MNLKSLERMIKIIVFSAVTQFNKLCFKNLNLKYNLYNHKMIC
jgi:hypothetical protein